MNIPGEVLRILPLAGAGIFAYAVWFVTKLIADQPSRRYRKLVSNEQVEVFPATFGSDEHKIRLAFQRIHIDVTGKEIQSRTFAYVFASMIAFFFLRTGLLMSVLISLSGIGLGYMLVNGFIEGSWKKIQMEIDSEIPLFLTGFTSTVQVQQDKLSAMYEEAQTLNPEGALRKWLMERFVGEYERYGEGILTELIKEAFEISNSLGVMMYMIQRFWVTGGDWEDAFVMGTENLEGILDARTQGEAQGANVRSSTMAITGILVFVIVIMNRSPATSEIIGNPLVQIGYVVLFLWMAMGWKYINGVVNEAF